MVEAVVEMVLALTFAEEIARMPAEEVEGIVDVDVAGES